ncbi:uncharacterized protein JN550_010197 [Neoarthrinium moseri]|uniref:uncharacterized protein n=1 Tax=Neoarthrinium moseri TaxID=1658444 RepID=UPI001FDC0691|nr:uncharacterized protein JN550_010197 [Neoarthrinium moseri]KAI1862335.1 hypothetical protein JN550_010197 [Neoarthrinium moseri]
MKFHSLLVLPGLLHLAAASCSKQCTFDSIVPSTTLTWCPCYDGFFCAKLDVPLDYQNPDFARASVPIIKYPAASNSSFGPYQGMVLLNPGGPGGSGVNLARENGTLVQAVVGNNVDVVGFDIRGTWLSEPVANCSGNLNLRRNVSLTSRFVPRLLDEYYESYIEYGKELGAECEKTSGGETGAGRYMSTAIIARDMLSIVDAFAQTDDGARAAKPSHLLNYYGISYGSFLGQTFASMFPDRVGNVILDGILSPEGYLANGVSNGINHLDGIIASFFVYCHEAGQAACSYYTGSTPRDIYERFNRSFTQLDPQKAEALNWSNATDINLALLTLKVGLLTAAHSPLDIFGILSPILTALEGALSTQSITTWTSQVMAIIGDPTVAGYENPEWSLGVACSDEDNRWYNKTLSDIRPLLADLQEQSIIGEVWSRSWLGCLGWSIKASEIFTGPFGGDTATPILFVSNTHDSVTPIENAISSAPKYKNAQILTIDGTGHTMVATQNKCAFAKVAAYFQANQMPGDDSFCPLEAGPFGIVLNGTLQENIDQAGLSDLVH